MASIFSHSSSPLAACSTAACGLFCCASFLASSKASWPSAMLLFAGARAAAHTPASTAAVTARCERATHASKGATRLLTSTGGCGGRTACSGAHPHSSTPAVRQTLTARPRYRLLRRTVSIDCFLSCVHMCASVLVDASSSTAPEQDTAPCTRPGTIREYREDTA